MARGDDQAARLGELLEREGALTLSEATGLLGVSESTARRLFTRMESEGGALRVHGGIRRVEGGYSFDRVDRQNAAGKARIARRVLPLLAGARSVYLDSGSTLARVAAEMARLPREGFPAVFTNSLRNVELLGQARPVHLLGGAYRPERRDFCGSLAEEALEKLRFDVCVLGADGAAGARFGATDLDTARLDGMVVVRSARVVVAADAGKFARGAMAEYARAASVGALVTDGAIPEAERRLLEAAGADIFVARDEEREEPI